MAKYGSFENVPLLDTEDIEAQNQIPSHSTSENRPASSQQNLDECPICYDDLKDKKIQKLKNCGHRFCMPCYGKLVDVTLQEEQLILKCPLCRSETKILNTRLKSIFGPLVFRGSFRWYLVGIMLLAGGAVIFWFSGKVWALVCSILLAVWYLVSLYA